MSDRLREIELQDLDLRGRRKALVRRLLQVMVAASILAIIGGGAVMMGIWLFYRIPGLYGLVIMISIYAAGAIIFAGTIAASGSYYREVCLSFNRLESLETLREEEVSVARRKVRALERQARVERRS